MRIFLSMSILLSYSLLILCMLWISLEIQMIDNDFSTYPLISIVDTFVRYQQLWRSLSLSRKSIIVDYYIFSDVILARMLINLDHRPWSAEDLFSLKLALSSIRPTATN